MKNYKFTLAHAASTPTSLELTHSPIGWNDKTITFQRNDTYNSVMRSYGLSLKFVREAMTYIQSAYESDGLNALVTITVEYLNKADFTYDTFYSGIIDFTTYKKTRDWIECSIIDNDLLSKFKSRDEIDLQLNKLKTIDGATITDFSNDLYKTLSIEGVDIHESIFAEFINPVITLSGFLSYDEDATDGAIYEELVWDDALEQYANDSGDNENIDFNSKATISWNLTFPEGISSITMKVEVDYTPSPYTSTIVTKTISKNIGSPIGDADSLSGEVSGSIILPNAGYIGRAKLKVNKSGNVTGTVTLTSGQLLINKVTTGADTSEVQAIYPDEAFQRLLELTTGDKTFRSDIVGRTDSDNYTYAADGSLSLVSILNGNNIRGFTQLLKPFTTSFKNLFKAINSISPIGFWYSHANSRWELKDITQFYGTNKILDLGEVSELEISIDESYYHNKIIAGTTKSLKYEKINGNQNFATKSEYSNDVKRISNIYDISTEYRSDDYGIELIRSKNWVEYYTEDIDGENDNFIIYCRRDDPDDFITFQGEDDFEVVTAKIPGTQALFYDLDTRLNLDIAPKRCMIRHGSLLAADMPITQGDIIFNNSQFNFNLGLKKSTDAAIIYESDDIDISDYDALYLPEIYNFTHPVTQATMTQLLSDPHGYIELTYEGTTYKGYILEVSTEPFNRNGNWTLIKANIDRL